jgi:LysM repeat protein
MPQLYRKAFVSMPLVICMLLAVLSMPAGAATRDDLLASAVRIRYERTEGGALITGHGTAFGIDLSPYGVHSRRLMLSAAHNVLDGRNQPYGTLKIEIIEGSRAYWTKVRVIASDESMDLCLLESAEDLPVLATLHDNDLQPGNPVILAGSPRGIPVSLYDGEIMKRFESGSIRSSARVVFDHGDSGGPFFCAKTMKVIGVAVAGVPKNGDLDHNIGLFVPLVGIDSFLQANLQSARKVGPSVASRAVSRPVVQKVVAEKAPAPIAPATPAPLPTPMPAVAAGSAHAEIIDVDTIVAAKVPAPAPAPAKLPVPEKSVAQKPVDSAPQIAVTKELKMSIASAPAPVIQAVQVVPAPLAPVAPAAPVAPVAQKVEPAPAPTPAAAPAAKPAKVVHVVQAGENLTKIARQYKIALTELVSTNGITDPNRITIGMKVTIPVQ